MFGLSFSKVLLLVAVIAIVWFGWRWFQRWEKERRAPAVRQAERVGRDDRDAPVPPKGAAAEDLVACPRCGTYVAAGAPHSCIRR
jgi:hypothetical protein